MRLSTKILLAFFLLVVFPAWGNAATVTFLEAGTDATQGFELWGSVNTTNNGAVTSDSSVFRTGPRSIKTNTGTPTAGNSYVQSPAGIVADAGTRCSLGFRAASFSALGKGTFLSLSSAGDADIVAYLGQISGGSLTLYNSVFTVLATGSTLSAATWYRVTFAYTITSTSVNEFRVYLDDSATPALTATNVSLANTASDLLSLGNRESTISTSIIYNFDDVYCDNGSTLDNISASDLRVTAKLPATLNENTWDGGCYAIVLENGTDRLVTEAGDQLVTEGCFPSVNERPISLASYVAETTSTQHNQSYTLEAASAGDVDLTGKTLLACEGWAWAKQSAVNGTPGLIFNGATTGKTLTTSPALYTVLVTGASYPSDAAGIGMRSAGDTGDVIFYEGGALCAYTSAAVAAAACRRALLGVGC